MEFRQVFYFIAIAEAEHFGRASKRLRVAQPALSRQIKLLETEIGASLFERLPRGVRLTEAGRVFLNNARRIRTEVQQSMEAARAAATGASGSLRLGFIEVVGWYGVVPDGIRLFRERHPRVNLSLVAMPTAEQLAQLRRGQIDAALVYNPPPDDDLTAIDLVRHGLLLAVPFDLPLAGRPHVTLAELTDLDFVGFQRRVSPQYHDDLTAAFHRAKFVPRYVAEMATETDMLALVSAGAGVALVNSCQRWRQPHLVRFMPVDDMTVQLRLALVHLKSVCPPTVIQFRKALDM